MTREGVNYPAMQPGILLALASAVLFGASTPFAKLLLGSVDPWLMAGLLYIGQGSAEAHCVPDRQFAWAAQRPDWKELVR
jgi:drug/metabolite transporter (DMT)-like permease